jgi:hypothetical protein
MDLGLQKGKIWPNHQGMRIALVQVNILKKFKNKIEDMYLVVDHQLLMRMKSFEQVFQQQINIVMN